MEKVEELVADRCTRKPKLEPRTEGSAAKRDTTLRGELDEEVRFECIPSNRNQTGFPVLPSRPSLVFLAGRYLPVVYSVCEVLSVASDGILISPPR